MQKKLISILIPVYNWNIEWLIEELASEIYRSNLFDKIELIIIDDASDSNELRKANRAICESYEKITIVFKEKEKNIGRARIRNTLIENASGKFFLFLDNDVVPDSKDFILNYLKYAKTSKYEVICGGISYKHRIMVDGEYDCYEYIGRKKDVKPASIRNLTPWRYFYTSNIMIKNEIAKEILVDERFLSYGFEDIEWGIRLSEKHEITHIDNTVSHLGLKSPKEYMEITTASMKNLCYLQSIHPDFVSHFPVAKWALFFEHLNDETLKLIQNLLYQLFYSQWIPNQIKYLDFQICKAIAFARELKGYKKTT